MDSKQIKFFGGVNEDVNRIQLCFDACEKWDDLKEFIGSVMECFKEV